MGVQASREEAKTDVNKVAEHPSNKAQSACPVVEPQAVYNVYNQKIDAGNGLDQHYFNPMVTALHAAHVLNGHLSHWSGDILRVETVKAFALHACPVTGSQAGREVLIFMSALAKQVEVFRNKHETLSVLEFESTIMCQVECTLLDQAPSRPDLLSVLCTQ